MKIAEKGSKYYDLRKLLAFYRWRPGEVEELNKLNHLTSLVDCLI
ncbi:hypothetical protein [Bacillus halotolerans]|nr:hypothetical protein [Bacillus halotolerans]